MTRDWKKFVQLTLIIIFAFFVCDTKGNENSCTFKAWASDGHQSLDRIHMRACPTARDVGIEHEAVRTGSNQIAVDDLAAHWSPENRGRLLLNVTMTARGEGDINLSLFSTRDIFPLFCGIISKRDDENIADEIMVQLKCLEVDLRVDDRMTLYASAGGPTRKRSVPQRINVDLPGCTLSRFKYTKLCKMEREKRVKFSVKREGTNDRPILKVTLHHPYKSDFEPRHVTRARRYNLAIHEVKNGDNLWGTTVRQHHEIRHPKRMVRFKYLKPSTTYVITVWRRGEGRRSQKEVTLC